MKFFIWNPQSLRLCEAIYYAQGCESLGQIDVFVAASCAYGKLSRDVFVKTEKKG